MHPDPISFDPYDVSLLRMFYLNKRHVTFSKSGNFFVFYIGPKLLDLGLIWVCVFIRICVSLKGF